MRPQHNPDYDKGAKQQAQMAKDYHAWYPESLAPEPDFPGDFR